MNHGRWRSTALLLAVSLPGTANAAETPLPYTQRTRPYSGWSSTIRGDIRTIGMSGAMVGLAHSFIGAGDNPAGLAMTLHSADAQISSNRILDGDLQSRDQALVSSNFGVALPSYPWGLSAGYWSPHNEGQAYRLSPSNTNITPEIFTQEFRVSVARVLLNNRLSVGIGISLGRATQILEFPDQMELSVSHASFALGGNVGVMLRLPDRLLPGRWIVGMSYSLPMAYSAEGAPAVPSEGTSGFFQTVKSPERFGLGVGWIPNRFFRAGLSFYLIGSTPEAALLSDNSRSVGQGLTLQPRIGASYRLAEFRELVVEVSAGSYLESARIQDTSSRPHLTGGLEVKPWIFTLGLAMDYADRYQNFIYSIGMDIPRLFRKLDWLPPEPHPPHGGFLPRLAQNSDEGLPRPLVKNWPDQKGKETRGQHDLLDIGQDLPGFIKSKITEKPKPKSKPTRKGGKSKR